MKMKRFFSGILAAVMSIVLIAAPLSTVIAVKADPETTNTDEEKCTIIINHAASTGTYTAYPIFEGNVEMEMDDDNKPTGRKLIDNPTFHANLETKISSSKVVAKSDKSESYGLWEYLKTNGQTVNEVSFYDMIKAYDPNSDGTFNLSITNSSASQQAEALANILNLTSKDTAVTNLILGNGKYSAFYSAFAEAARTFMVDNITEGTKDTLSGTAVGTHVEGSTDKVIIEVDAPGYYLVEYTPEGDLTDYEITPRAVRRSLVLVGRGDDLSAEINSKDTQNIATVDVRFNVTMLKKENDEYKYNGNEGLWAKNVSAGNGDYVNCRVMVTLPGNFEAYDQYYLAVPIMYGYNTKALNTNDFDRNNSIIRQGSDKDNVKVYLFDDVDKRIIDNKNFDIITNSYEYADDKTNPTGGVDKDKFVANEIFVFKDIANIDVKADETSEPVLAKNSNFNKLVIEFPVKFDRFNKNTLPSGVTPNLGFNGSSNASTAWTGDDALLKNYITVKAVYSNNPNLKALAEGANENDLTNSQKLYLNTSKDPGALQNPVGIAKESSANIVTYRLRVHATTEDLCNISKAGGVEGIRFVLYDNANKKYAVVKALANDTSGDYVTYDTVEGEILRDNKGPSNEGKTRFYKITGWENNYITTGEGEEQTETINEECVLTTFNHKGTNTAWANNNTGRFEIVGLAPGNYTIIALDKTIKTYEVYKGNTTDNDWKEYSISKEGGKPKTKYRFSFAPTLSTTCTKLSYNTHYAPNDFDLSSLYTYIGSGVRFNTNGKYDFSQPGFHSVNTTGLITNYNMKWYNQDGNEITPEGNNPDWWLGQRNDVALMSMRITYIKKGLSLPVTGGIGTFIFYAVGGVIVLLSTVALITKFRIKRERL